jgi:hypothetical protein
MDSRPASGLSVPGEESWRDSAVDAFHRAGHRIDHRSVCSRRRNPLAAAARGEAGGDVVGNFARQRRQSDDVRMARLPRYGQSAGGTRPVGSNPAPRHSGGRRRRQRDGHHPASVAELLSGGRNEGRAGSRVDRRGRWAARNRPWLPAVADPLWRQSEYRRRNRTIGPQCFCRGGSHAADVHRP